MTKDELNFKQERDFGELFNATFSFIGVEFKRLGTAVLFYVVPFLLAISILGVFLGIRQQETIHSLSTMDSPFSMFNSFGPYWAMSMLLAIIASTSMTCTILGYIKLYVNKGRDNFTVKEVGNEVISNFFPVLGTSLLAGIIIGIGFIFCIIPGIYLGVSLSVLLPLIVIEGNSLGDAFSRSFKLVKPKFWMVLGALFIMIVLVYILSLFFSLPSIVMGMKHLFLNMKENQNMNFDFGISYYIFNSLSSLLTYIVSAIPTVLIAFIYFSLVEYNEKPSLKSKIEQISADE
ncbi:MAG TPA: glycerophosphoryl diester phosphodiesterase membrane domain-containing protein [Bacteroidales bacterium]|nr:glycerophosphoryl diester phosphodiesterase membrane domain-containing protein [Bacteroidales bacterium]